MSHIQLLARIALVVVAKMADAQVPTLGTTPVRESGERSLPANNPWFTAGAQLGFKFDGNSEFSDDLVASARTVIRTLKFVGQNPRVGIPLIGNISKLTAGTPNDSIKPVLDKILSTTEGLNLGLYPYYETVDRSGDNPAQAQFTVYGSAAWKLNTARNLTDSSVVTIHSGRFSMGLGLDLYVAEGTPLPISLSVEPVVTLVDRSALAKVSSASDVKGRLLSFEITNVIPLHESFGLLTQVSVNERGKPPFRIGLVYMSSPGSATRRNPEPNESSGTIGAVLVGTVTEAVGNAAVASADVTTTLFFESSGRATSPDGKKCSGQTRGVAAISAKTDANGRYRVELSGDVVEWACAEIKVERSGKSHTVAKEFQFTTVKKPADLAATVIDIVVP